MAQRLHPSLKFHDDETPTSFVSRLAILHRIPSARRFCADLGFSLQKFAEGDEETLTRFSELAGVPAEAMERNALRRGDDRWHLRGERLFKWSLRRKDLLVCPVCLKEDRDVVRESPEIAMYGRVAWQIEHVRTCPRHAVALTLGAATSREHDVHDFAARVQAAATDVDDLVDQAKPRRPSGLENYLIRRIEGDLARFPLLDALEFSAAAKTCEVLGAVAVFGRTPHVTKFTGDDWHRAGAAGFEITSGGESSIRTFLSGLQSSYKRAPGGKEQPNAFYGRIYQWLGDAPDEAFEPIREIVRRHAIETMPLGPGDRMLGKPVERRVLHSLHTASLEYNVDKARLRKMLATRGFLLDHDETATANLVYFDAQAAHDFLSRACGGLSLAQTGTYLGADRVHANLLARHHFIEPVVSAADPGIGGNSFARADLDAFLARLVRDAVPVAIPPDTAVDIPRAAKLANCGAMEVVRLILDCKLGWVGRLADKAGYFSVLVKAEEVKPLVRGEASNDLSLREVERKMATSFSVVKALIANGRLPVRRTLNPATRHAIDVVSREDVEAFQIKYVSLAVLAKERGLDLRTLPMHLRSQGIHPALDPEVYKARFYLRADVGPKKVRTA